MNVECRLAVKFWQKRASNARLWQAFRTPSTQLYYIYAFRSVGTARKMSGSHCGKGKEFKVNFWNAGEKIKCKWGVFPSTALKKINWISTQTFRNWFLFGKLLSFSRVGWCKWYFMLSFSRWKSWNVLCILWGSDYSLPERQQVRFFFHWEVKLFTDTSKRIF